jgi:hypothetical protein
MGACNTSGSVHTEADGDVNGYTNTACSVCSHIDESSKVWDSHTSEWSTYSANVSTIATNYADTSYTTTSRTNYKNACDLITNTVVLNDETKSADYIEAKSTAIASAATTYLDAVADFTLLDDAYAKGDALLRELSNEAPQYTQASVNALITAVGNAETYATNAAVRQDTSATNEQITVNTTATTVTTAIANLETAKPETGADISALREAISQVKNIDTDLYDLGETTPDAAIEVDTSSVAGTPLVYTDSTSANYSIKTIANDASASDVNYATGECLTRLTSSLKEYTITVSSNATAEFNGTGSNRGSSPTYYSTANNSVVFRTSDGEPAAWYMSFNSTSTGRSRQYQCYGATFKAHVLGNMTVTAVQPSGDKTHKVTIYRQYGDESPHIIQCIDYAGSSYELPDAPAIALYSFNNYSYNGATINDDSITGISGDISIIAHYTKNESKECAVRIEDVSGNAIVNETYEYNTKIEASDASAYAWVIKGTTDKLLYVGSKLTYFAADSTIRIAAIDETTYNNNYASTMPNVYLNDVVQKVAVNDKTKLMFSGFLVENNNINIVEYGILFGAGINEGTITDADMLVENAGSHENYKLLRAKSSKIIGSNQFSIGVTTNISTNFKYCGYIIYEVTSGGTTKRITQYTDVYSDPAV